MMKSFALTLLAVSLISTSYGQAPTESYHAVLNRSTAGRILDDRGLPTGTLPLEKGKDYNVVEQKVGYLVIMVGGKKVSVPPGDATVTKGTVIPPASRPAQPAIIGLPERAVEPTPVSIAPGTIELLSAKYTLMGNQPRNVKNKLVKLIPAGVIDKSVNILVTDALSTAAAAQGNATQYRNGYNVIYREHPKNILTVEYSFNGEIRTKQAIEGGYLTLP